LRNGAASAVDRRLIEHTGGGGFEHPERGNSTYALPEAKEFPRLALPESGMATGKLSSCIEAGGIKSFTGSF